MAKVGNVSSGDKGITRGPCTDCGTNDGTFQAVRRIRPSGKRSIVRLCEKCVTKV